MVIVRKNTQSVTLFLPHGRLVSPYRTYICSTPYRLSKRRTGVQRSRILTYSSSTGCSSQFSRSLVQIRFLVWPWSRKREFSKFNSGEKTEDPIVFSQESLCRIHALLVREDNIIHTPSLQQQHRQVHQCFYDNSFSYSYSQVPILTTSCQRHGQHGYLLWYPRFWDSHGTTSQGISCCHYFSK